MKYYYKILTSQELGYRKGFLRTGGYFYISKDAINVIFSELSRTTINDKMILEFENISVENGCASATLVYHNDKHSREQGSRDEYRIYLNRDIAIHDLTFRPGHIVCFEKLDTDKFNLFHMTNEDENYACIKNRILSSRMRGAHMIDNEKLF